MGWIRNWLNAKKREDEPATASEIKFTLDGVNFSVSEGPYQDGGQPSPAALEFAKSIVGELPAARLFAASEFLETYNDGWREEGDEELDEPRFVERLTDPSVTLDDELGAATIFFSDSEMFAGHFIVVSLTDGRPSHADLFG